MQTRKIATHVHACTNERVPVEVAVEVPEHGFSLAAVESGDGVDSADAASQVDECVSAHTALQCLVATVEPVSTDQLP